MRYSFANGYFYPVDDQDDLDASLMELFSTEYAIGELKMRTHHNPRLGFSHRVTYWRNKFKDHALQLANNVAPQLLKDLQQWFSHHTTSGFADMAMGMNEGGDMDEDMSSISPDGMLVVGSPLEKAFKYDMRQATMQAFARQNPYFVDTFIGEEENSNREAAEYEQEEYTPMLFDSEEDRVQHVAEWVADAGYTWPALREWLEQFGDFDVAVKEAITAAYPLWKQHWGADVMARAERDVKSAIDRLQKAIGGESLGDLSIAINVALNTQHVHGKMSMHMDIGTKTLESLSNLDTDAIDEYLSDVVTGPGWKQANWEELLDSATKIASMDIDAFLRYNAKIAAYSFRGFGYLEPLYREEEFSRAMIIQRKEIERFRQEMIAERGHDITPESATIEWIRTYATEWRERYTQAKMQQPLDVAGHTVDGNLRKYASSYNLASVPKRALVRHDTVFLPDTDRYISDDYAVHFSLQETIERYSIGVYVTNHKVGITGYQQYWHFPLEKKREALRTYGLIESIIQETAGEIKYNAVPHGLIKTFLRNRLDKIDLIHKERSGVYHYNWYMMDVDKADDWRETIYGLRYPQGRPESLEEDPNVLNVDDTSREIVSSGTSSRDKTMHFRYDENQPKKPNYPRRRLKRPPPRVISPFESQQADIFANVKPRQAKEILVQVVSGLGPEVNSLDSLARNKLWTGSIAPALRSRGIPSTLMGFLHSVFSSWSQAAFAAKSRKWKVAYSVL